MSGAPITVFVYRNGVYSCGAWITDPPVLERVRAIVAEGGKQLLADTIWYEREPWTERVTKTWGAVDSFDVALYLDEDYTPPPLPPPSPRRAPTRKERKQARKR